MTINLLPSTCLLLGLLVGSCLNHVQGYHSTSPFHVRNRITHGRTVSSNRFKRSIAVAELYDLLKQRQLEQHHLQSMDALHHNNDSQTTTPINPVELAMKENLNHQGKVLDFLFDLFLKFVL